MDGAAAKRSLWTVGQRAQNTCGLEPRSGKKSDTPRQQGSNASPGASLPLYVEHVEATFRRAINIQHVSNI